MKKRNLKKLLGPRGMSGIALREASDPDMIAVRDLIQGQLRQLLKMEGDDDPWPYVLALYADNVVVDIDGQVFSYGYTIAGQEVALGEPVEVAREFVPVKPAEKDDAEDATLVEALGGGAFKVRVIRAGMSGNRNFYSDAVLREAVGLFEGARVFEKSDAEHITGGGKAVSNLIGALSGAAFKEGVSPDTGEIMATLTLIVGDDSPTAVKLREAVEKNLTHLFGLSIDADGTARMGQGGIRIAEAINKVKSVDLIVEPGAGGQVISFIEALDPEGDREEEEETIMDRDEIIALITKHAPELLEGKDVAQLTDEELKALLEEAMKEEDETSETTPAELIEALDRRAKMREAIARSALPDRAKDRLRARFEATARFTEAQVIQAIKDEAAYIGVGAGGHVVGLGGTARFVETGASPAERAGHMLDAFFDPRHKDHGQARSLKECYIAITGDDRVTGQKKHARFAEALTSTSFDDVLGDSITRRMIADYRSKDAFDIWRLLTGEPVPVNDFRTQERTRFGGYGDLPAVVERAAYQALSSPSDEAADYKVSKRGGLETITLEMIKNDDVGAVQKIPTRLSRAAKRTLCKFVLDFIRTNPTIYDGKALFHADHGNLGSTALSAANFAAARLAMVTQTEFGGLDTIGVGPKYLWVPHALEETAADLFRRNTNLDETFIQSLKPTIVPVWYWTDANDWAISADVDDVPIIEIGFLDGNEEPELFVQDSPTSGSFFSNDEITYKIRHIYGGTALDWRGVRKHVVT